MLQQNNTGACSMRGQGQRLASHHVIPMPDRGATCRFPCRRRNCLYTPLLGLPLLSAYHKVDSSKRCHLFVQEVQVDLYAPDLWDFELDAQMLQHRVQRRLEQLLVGKHLRW